MGDTAKRDTQRHIINAVVENKPGVLARIASLFSARGFNIESLNVGETESSEWSSMTITVSGDRLVLEQVRKQLEKLIDTFKVTEMSEVDSLEVDMSLIKIKVPPNRRGEMADLARIFQARIADVSERHMIVEVSGGSEKIEHFVKLATPYGIVEMVRSGRLAIKRGD